MSVIFHESVNIQNIISIGYFIEDSLEAVLSSLGLQSLPGLGISFILTDSVCKPVIFDLHILKRFKTRMKTAVWLGHLNQRLVPKSLQCCFGLMPRFTLVSGCVHRGAGFL